MYYTSVHMKLPFGFGLNFFVRTLFPGFVWSTLSFPFLKPFLTNYVVPIYDMSIEYFFVAEVIIVGMIVTMADLFIYRLYEGYEFYPFSKKLTEHKNKKVRKLYKEYIEKENSDKKYVLTWEYLSKFPISESTGIPEAKAPTNLGNVVLGYEHYPKSRYDIDGPFFWYRLIPKLDTNIVRSLDHKGTFADSAVYTSFLCLILSLSLTFILLIKIIGIEIPAFLRSYPKVIELLSIFFSPKFPGTFTVFIFLIISFSAMLLFNYLAVRLHYDYGEIFKTVFDIYLDEFKLYQEVKEDKNYWRRLKFYVMKCSKCNKKYSAKDDHCPYCNQK